MVLNKRMDWIDSIKGFGAILVILGHLNPMAPIECYIYSFHMPLFFFLSGILKSRQKNFVPFLQKKAKSLLIPFVIWNLVSVLYRLIIHIPIKSVIIETFFLQGKMPHNTPIWFLLTLFMCEVTYHWFYLHRIPNWLIVTFAAAISPFVSELSQLPFTIYILPISILFYTLGVMFSNIILQDNKLINIKRCISPILLVFSILFGVVLNDRISMANGYYHNFLYFYIASISGILFWTMLFKAFSKIKLLAKIGKQSLFLMCFQYMFFSVIDIFSKKLFSYSVWYEVNTMKAIIATIGTLLIAYLIIWIADTLGKRFPIISRIALLFGIRPLS